ncbi:COMMD10 [Bugula neritina]|uniref:COMMD10 n=1 Tax=Bugula neritina TaxID=10212 RepID=A0A7J7ISY8_BUGNE|nr:COMMD10 [Bugula neritina]
MAMFTETPSLKGAVGLIQTISVNKLQLVLKRLVENFHTQDEAAFSEEEVNKLCSSFKMAKEDVDLVLTTCKFFLSQAAYHNSKPGAFAKHLASIGMDQDRCMVFHEVWDESGKSINSLLRQKSMAVNQLETINWQLSLQIAQKSKTKQKTPRAVFELGIKDSSKQEITLLIFANTANVEA